MILTPEEIEQQIKDERARHEELNAEIREWEKKKREQQKRAGGSASSSQHTTKTSKDIRKLENRLQLVSNEVPMQAIQIATFLLCAVCFLCSISLP